MCMYICMYVYTRIHTCALIDIYVDDKVVTVIKISGVDVNGYTTLNTPNLIKISGVTSLVILLGYWMCKVVSKTHKYCIFKYSAYFSIYLFLVLCSYLFFFFFENKNLLVPRVALDFLA